MTTMRQIQLTEWGDESVLHEANVPIPTPVRGHVLIKTVAAGVNPIDVTTCKGLGPAAQLADPSYRPFVPGWDVAGTVVATAGDYTGFKVGDGVFGMVTFPYPGGAYAEYVLAPAYQLAKVPSDVPCAQLGGAPLAGLTAYQSLFEVAHLKEGERVLIHAGAGGVGHLAVQLAIQAGAQVFATASAANHEFVRSLGAQPIDYRTEDFRAVLGQTMDVVLNSTGRQTFLDSLEVLVPGGRIVTLTNPDPLDVARERGFEAQWLTAHPDRTQMQEIARLMSLGLLKVHVEKIFPLAGAAAAQELMASGHTRGKIVLVP